MVYVYGSEKLYWMLDYIFKMNWVLVGFTLTLLFICLYCLFNMKEVKHGDSFSSLIEYWWTIAAVLVMVILAVPSMWGLKEVIWTKLSYITLMAIGNQWYWEYILQLNNFYFDQMVVNPSLRFGTKRIFDSNGSVMLPLNTSVQVLTTSSDVVHCWCVPSLGLKLDAVPGRVMEGTLNCVEAGVKYGLCCEICGFKHYNMPISLKFLGKMSWLEMISNRV